MEKKARIIAVIAASLVLALLIVTQPQAKSRREESLTITNVSYDSTHNFYSQYNPLFATYWKAKTGQSVSFVNSYAGSGAQANAVVSGLNADVATLALGKDISTLQKAGLVSDTWKSDLPEGSAPYTSTIVFLVRKGNPKHIKDWSDLTKSGVNVITPNPKSSGGARWNYLAAWAYAMKTYGSEPAAKAFEKKLYQNVSVMDASARASLTTFENGQGDVAIAWENDAMLAVKQNPGDYELIRPSISIEAQPTVALVKKNAEQNGTTKVATAFLSYLYSPAAQKVAAENYYRPTDKKVAAAFKAEFPTLSLVKISDPMFGGWSAVQKKQFADGGIFDQISN